LLEKSQTQPKTLQNNKLSEQRVEIGYVDEDFWIVFNDITKGILFGTIEMTIIAGVIDTIKINQNYKIKERVDKDGRKIVELR
jgi:hypothetical protein